MPAANQPIAVERSGLPATRLDDWLGLWMMQEDRALALEQFVRRADLDQHFRVSMSRDGRDQAEQTFQSQTRYDIHQSDVAVVKVHGLLMKPVSSFGMSTSTVALRKAFRAIADDSKIGAVLLHIDSPGGTFAGMDDCAADLWQLRQKKPVWAFVEDLGASAAYYLASQCNRVVVNPSGVIGAIGTYAVVWDTSAAAEQAGIRVHVVRAGKFKGAGEDGTQVTDEQLADFQRVIDEANQFFLDAVARGRGFNKKKLEELADGRVHRGKQAVELGLADAAQSLDLTLKQLSSPSQRSKSMSHTVIDQNQTAGDDNPGEVKPPARPQQQPTQQQAQPAALAELKAACPGASSDFLMQQLEASATREQASAAYTAHLLNEKNQLEQKNRELAEKQQQQAERPGVDRLQTKPSGASSSADGEARAEVQELVAAKMKQGMTRPVAHAAVMREHPELREQLVEQANAGRTNRR